MGGEVDHRLFGFTGSFATSTVRTFQVISHSAVKRASCSDWLYWTLLPQSWVLKSYLDLHILAMTPSVAQFYLSPTTEGLFLLSFHTNSSFHIINLEKK